MKKWAFAILLVLGLGGSGCSLPPERPVYRDELYRTHIYQTFTIKDTPESVLAALNRDGEIVIEGFVKDKAFYIWIFATPNGLKVKTVER